MESAIELFTAVFQQKHLDLLLIRKGLDLPQSESWQNRLCFHFHFTAQVQRLFITKSLKLASPVHLPRLVGIFVQSCPAKQKQNDTERLCLTSKKSGNNILLLSNLLTQSTGLIIIWESEEGECFSLGGDLHCSQGSLLRERSAQFM